MFQLSFKTVFCLIKQHCNQPMKIDFFLCISLKENKRCVLKSKSKYQSLLYCQRIVDIQNTRYLTFRGKILRQKRSWRRAFNSLEKLDIVHTYIFNIESQNCTCFSGEVNKPKKSVIIPNSEIHVMFCVVEQYWHTNWNIKRLVHCRYRERSS